MICFCDPTVSLKSITCPATRDFFKKGPVVIFIDSFDHYAFYLGLGFYDCRLGQRWNDACKKRTGLYTFYKLLIDVDRRSPVGVVIIKVLNLDISCKAPQFLPDLELNPPDNRYRQYHHAKTEHNADDGNTHNELGISAVRFKRNPGRYE